MGSQAHQSEQVGGNSQPTVWGLTALDVGAVFWTSFGVDCVALGSGKAPQEGADLYLLEMPEERALFDLPALHRRLLWNGADVTVVTLEDELSPEYSERVEVDDGSVVRIRRIYGAERRPIATVRLAASREIAVAWASCRSPEEFAAHADVIGSVLDAVTVPGTVLRASEVRCETQRAFIERVVRTVPHPDRVLRGVEPVGVSGAYAMMGQPLAPADLCVGAVWIGDLGTEVRADPLIAVGPAFIADVVDRPPVEIRPIAAIFSPDSPSRAERIGSERWGYTLTKRAFDIVFSLTVLIAIAPILLVACVLIAVEDGLPVHYFQWRESLGGREFRCWKLRSMRRGAESMVAQLQALNQSDGPQVFIKNDPRVTRIGRIIRKLQIDEFPQFLNVLLGDMSVVGPRPSPRKENQFCPAWRETRLSVRPGITGLWQVMRTRAPGKDFQEWIRYDTEYVERMGFWLDMWIIWRTVVNLVTGGRKPGQDS